MDDNSESHDIPDLGEQLVRRVKAGFILQGTSLRQWCRAHGMHGQNALVALRGGWRGPSATRWIKRICRAAHIENVHPDG